MPLFTGFKRADEGVYFVDHKFRFALMYDDFDDLSDHKSVMVQQWITHVIGHRHWRLDTDRDDIMEYTGHCEITHLPSDQLMAVIVSR